MANREIDSRATLPWQLLVWIHISLTKSIFGQPRWTSQIISPHGCNQYLSRTLVIGQTENDSERSPEKGQLLKTIPSIKFWITLIQYAYWNSDFRFCIHSGFSRTVQNLSGEIRKGLFERVTFVNLSASHSWDHVSAALSRKRFLPGLIFVMNNIHWYIGRTTNCYLNRWRYLKSQLVLIRVAGPGVQLERLIWCPVFTTWATNELDCSFPSTSKITGGCIL